MNLYAVEIEQTRRAFFFVRAEDAAGAREAGEELSESLGSNDWETDDSLVAREVPEARVRPMADRMVLARVWSGGPKGDWIEENVPASLIPWWLR